MKYEYTVDAGNIVFYYDWKFCWEVMSLTTRCGYFTSITDEIMQTISRNDHLIAIF